MAALERSGSQPQDAQAPSLSLLFWLFIPIPGSFPQGLLNVDGRWSFSFSCQEAGRRGEGHTQSSD